MIEQDHDGDKVVIPVGSPRPVIPDLEAEQPAQPGSGCFAAFHGDQTPALRTKNSLRRHLLHSQAALFNHLLYPGGCLGGARDSDGMFDRMLPQLWQPGVAAGQVGVIPYWVFAVQALYLTLEMEIAVETKVLKGETDLLTIPEPQFCLASPMSLPEAQVGNVLFLEAFSPDHFFQ